MRKSSSIQKLREYPPCVGESSFGIIVTFGNTSNIIILFRCMKIAHVNMSSEEIPRLQSMQEHAEGVASLCKTFCHQIAPQWGQIGALLGHLHDFGKHQEAFQQYIKMSAGLPYEGYAPSRAPHSATGAILAIKTLAQTNPELARLLAYCVSGHHRGLYDFTEMDNALRDPNATNAYRHCRDEAKEVTSELEAMIRQAKDLDILDKDIVASEDRPLLIRMLFSALVDADYLDTESFMQAEVSDLRRQGEIQVDRTLWENLRDKLRAHTDRFRADTRINEVRAQFLAQCRAHGQSEGKGIHSLFLPTGAGKTLSSLAWALESAVRHSASRIIFVIPYTSITTQTAGILRDILGEEYILEHHSEISIEDEDKHNRAKLLSENWDAPIIITTNVQFFESLYAHRTSRCRKLHNICNSVIVFDEVQMFPSEFLNPMLRGIESLYCAFEANILLCTATQPVFTESFHIQGKRDSNFYSIKEIGT